MPSPWARLTKLLKEKNGLRPTHRDTVFNQEDEGRAMGRKSRFESAALEHAYAKFVGTNKKAAAAFEEEVANAEIGRKIYDLRMAAGLTQGELAKVVGTTASVISRLEDADYEGHSLAMLRRIAKALNQRVEIRFLPLKDARQPI